MINPDTIRDLLPPLVLRRLRRWARAAGIWAFERRGRIPFSRGYGAYKARAIDAALHSDETLERFRRITPLPSGYGIGIDERIVEYPWLFSRLPHGPASILDAGSILNQEYLLDHSLLRDKQLSILTLAPEAECHWKRGISYLFGDLRDIPVKDAFFDAIVCVSTLEHVGCDNTLYTGRPADAEDRPEDFRLAIKELNRVLKPGGSLLLTVPFGVHRHWGTFQQFDERLLQITFESFAQPSAIDPAYYRYTSNGWNVATARECADAVYVEWSARHPLPRPLPVEPDRAAAARAVACVQFTRRP